MEDGPELPEPKGVKIVYRLLLVNCYLLHVPRHPSQAASNVGGWVIDIFLAWTMTRNNLSIIWISLDEGMDSSSDEYMSW